MKDRIYMLIRNEREILNEFDLVEKTQLIEEKKMVIVYLERRRREYFIARRSNKD